MSELINNATTAVRRLFTDVFGAGHVDVADEILTRDFRFQYPFAGFPPGVEGLVAFTKAFHSAFPNFELEINELYGGAVGEVENARIEDVRVGIRWTFRGTHKGDFLGARATGKYATFSAIGEYRPGGGGRPPGGKLSAGWLEMNTLGLLQHLEVVRPTPTLLPTLRPR